MKYSKNNFEHYEVPDFLLDDSFIQWVNLGKPGDHSWARRISDSDILRETAQDAEKVIKNLKPRSRVEDPQQIADLKYRISQKIETLNMRDKFRTYNPRKFKPNYFSYAAAIVLLILLSGMLYYALFPVSEPIITETPTYEIRKTRSGQKLTLHLSDGTKVKLNSEAEIKFEKPFGDTRNVYLVRGEAFFEVAKDKERPFRVMSENTITEALGTSFNVNIVDTNVTKVALVTGKVLVSSQKDSVVLNPGSYVSCDKTGISDVTNFDLSEVAWKDEILIFNDANGLEIISTLEKWYGVQIQSNVNNLNEWQYSGRFEDQSLRQVLNSIGAVEKFEFEIQEDKVIINQK